MCALEEVLYTCQWFINLWGSLRGVLTSIKYSLVWRYFWMWLRKILVSTVTAGGSPLSLYGFEIALVVSVPFYYIGNRSRALLLPLFCLHFLWWADSRWRSRALWWYDRLQRAPTSGCLALSAYAKSSSSPRRRLAPCISSSCTIVARSFPLRGASCM